MAALTLGASISTTIVFTAGAPISTSSTLVANPNSAIANGNATMALTFTAVDAYSNRASNVPVTLSGPGGNNTFGSISGSTDANGMFLTTLASTLA